jgi:hypothetical protein
MVVLVVVVDAPVFAALERWRSAYAVIVDLSRCAAAEEKSE